MSLFIIGSVSRITSNIVHQLAKNKQYSRITIADILPTYQHHHRFYRLQRQLDNLNYDIKVNLQRLNLINDLKKQSKYDDVLYVTHDYYTSVVSKTKLMEHTAEACKNRQYLYFATPVQYDHFGFQNPQSNYLKSQKRVLQINPNSTFIRSDVHDKTQTLAYFNLPQKNYIEQRVFSTKFNFSPYIVKSTEYAKVVCDVLAKKVQGKKILVKGKQCKDAFYGDYSKDLPSEQYKHAKQNIVQLAQKYNVLKFSGYETPPQ